VMRRFRRGGVGHQAATQLFMMLPGHWQVRQLASNAGATQFWRKVIPVEFTESIGEEGPIQHFVIEP
jgi:predicted acetyltransferase